MSASNRDVAMNVRPRIGLFDRARLSLAADWLVVGVAVSLPWSTSLTGILTVLWLITLAPTLRLVELRRIASTPAGALPLVFVALALIGMTWADIPFRARLEGLESFLKFLAMPLLFFQYANSPRGYRVLLGFVVSVALVMPLSWLFFALPTPPWPTNEVGVPVKDRILLSEMFVICAFWIAPFALDAWRTGARVRAIALAALMAAFFLNIIYVTTARTAFVVIVVLVLLFGWWRARWHGVLIAVAVGVALGAAAWSISPHLRERISGIGTEITDTLSTGKDTSAGARMLFWMGSLELLRERPFFGYGTGAIREAFRRIEPDPGAAPPPNPHNQILATALQLGAVGVAVLLAFWLSHLLLFRGGDLVSWFGLVMVVQNAVASLFNSHLFDFGQGWLYVFGVGVLGGMAMGGRTLLPGSAERPP
jgi:O-antigen ligase